MMTIIGMFMYGQYIVKNPSFEDGLALCGPSDSNTPFYLHQGNAYDWTREVFSYVGLLNGTNTGIARNQLF